MSTRKGIKPTNNRKNRGSAKPGVMMPAPDTLAAMPEGYSTLLAGIKERIAHELKTAFPGLSGFSPLKLKCMQSFADAWPDRTIVQRTVAQLFGRSNLTLLDKLSDPEIRLWHAQKALETGMGKVAERLNKMGFAW